jgi:hypothetical protein
MLRSISFSLGLLVLAQTGCSSMNNTEKGALAGGAIGAGLGTAVGAATGNPKTGAVVGGLLGGGLGGLIGNDVDKVESRDNAVRQAANDRAYADQQPNRIYEIIDLTKQGHDDRTIINHMRKNRMTFDLSVVDLKTLKDNGVAPSVIHEMQTGGKVAVAPPAPRTVVVREQVPVMVPAYPPPPVVVAQPAFGFHYQRRW